MKKLYSTTLLLLALAPAALAQKAVTNLTSGTEFDGLSAAITAAESGDVLQINKDIDVSFVINPLAKTITIQGVTPGITINVKNGSNASLKQFINLNKDAADGALTLKDIVVNAESTPTTNKFIEQANGSLTLENVIIKNLTYNSTYPGIVRTTGTSTATTLMNLSFENCVMPENSPYEIYNNQGDYSPIISGNADYDVWLNQSTASITDGGMTADSKVNIFYNKHNSSVPVVKGTTDIFKFNLDVIYNDTDADKTPKMLAPTGNDLFAINEANVLLINPAESGVQSQGGSTIGAVQKAAVNGAMIVVNANTTETSALSFAGKTIEIIGANSDATVAASNIALFNPAANTDLTIKNLAITWSLSSDADSNFAAQAGKADSKLTLDNVVFKNCSSKQSFVRSLNGGILALNGVSFDNCEMTSNQSFVTFNNPGCSISGKNDNLSLTINNAGTNSNNAEGLEMCDSPIRQTLSGLKSYKDNPDNYDHGHLLITGCEDTSLFSLTNNGWTLSGDSDGIRVLDNIVVTGIEDVDVEAEADGEAEYYDLRGIRMSADALTTGIYLRRQGGKVAKVAIR